jgi:hypothetical protein
MLNFNGGHFGPSRIFAALGCLLLIALQLCITVHAIDGYVVFAQNSDTGAF